MVAIVTPPGQPSRTVMIDRATGEVIASAVVRFFDGGVTIVDGTEPGNSVDLVGDSSTAESRSAVRRPSRLRETTPSAAGVWTGRPSAVHSTWQARRSTWRSTAMALC